MKELLFSEDDIKFFLYFIEQYDSYLLKEGSIKTALFCSSAVLVYLKGVMVDNGLIER
jgi:hypothetical protein